MDSGFQKILFLSKIQHKDYEIIKDLCLEDSTFTITDCISKMKAKHKRVTYDSKPHSHSCQVSQTIMAAEASKLSKEDQVKCNDLKYISSNELKY